MPKFARVTFGEGDPARMDEGIANLNETVIPRARELPGFQGGYWLADRTTGQILAVVVFDGGDHRNAVVGCIVWPTTASSSADRVSRSTCSRRRAPNASIVLAASYLR